MSFQMDPRLEQARRLIENREREEARTLLTSIIRSDPENVDALFLYAHVARTNQEAQAVLERALEIDPSFNDARIALNKLKGGRSGGRQNAAQQSNQSGGGSSLVLMLLFFILVAVSIFAGWVILFNLPEDEPQVQIPPTLTQTATRTPTRTPTPGPTIDPTDLPASWTPGPTNTTSPSGTPPPTITPPPTLTKIPTLTPTTIQVQTLEPDLASLNYVYTVYFELAAQGSASDDVVAVQGVQAALLSLIQGIDESEFGADVAPEYRDFLDDLKAVIQAEIEVAVARETLLNVQSECAGQETSTTCSRQIDQAQADFDTARAAWLAQDEIVSLSIITLNRSGTATASYNEQIELLKTPSVTPIVLN